MLFNKHSETKQRFGIRKLTIGATSVLLSTLFLTVNNGQKYFFSKKYQKTLVWAIQKTTKSF